MLLILLCFEMFIVYHLHVIDTFLYVNDAV
jgi:hypothetical protein